MKLVWILLSIAFAFWFLIFSPWTQSHIPFWTGMSIATFFLGICSIISNRNNKSLLNFKPKYIIIGLGSALALYLFFLCGGFAVKLFGFADRGVNDIYTIRQQAPLIVIGVLIFFVIGPCEELFWRGFVQNRLSKRYGDITGYLLAAFFYAIGHIWSFNFMLILTAGICALFWGFIFNRYKSVWPVIISHAFWDLTIFVLLPVTTFTQ